jgi:anti-anti-sigma factor
MKIHVYAKGPYQILRVEDEVRVISDLSELRTLIDGYLGRGLKHIAVSFTNAAYIYSGAIAVLIDCHKRLKRSGGVLCIIEPKSEIKYMFSYLGIDSVMPVCDSEESLPPPDAS